MIDWDTDRERAVAAIRTRSSRLGILLKTKDDAYFLDAWIKHHAAIVGMRNLVIIDNGSSDQRVRHILESFGPDLLTISYSGFHNDLHSPERVPDLYKAIRDSFRYFSFLDCDERLILVRGDRWYANALIPDFIGQFPRATVFAAPWLYCVPRFSKLVKFGRTPSDLHDDIRWGKPVLYASMNLRGWINHNVQVDRALYAEEIPCGLFVLHLAHLSAKQRIASNIKKLIARKFATSDDSVKALLERDLTDVTDNNVRLYISEISRLVNVPEPVPNEECKAIPGHIGLNDDSAINYFSDEESFLMSSYLLSRGRITRSALWAE